MYNKFFDEENYTILLQIIVKQFNDKWFVISIVIIYYTICMLQLHMQDFLLLHIWYRNAIYEENCIKSGESCQHNEHLHRLLSGIQTSIAAFAAENYTCTNIEDAYIKRNSLPKYTYNLLHYVEKIGKYPERIYNLMYTFEFLLLSTCRLKPLLLKYASLMTCRAIH